MSLTVSTQRLVFPLLRRSSWCLQTAGMSSSSDSIELAITYYAGSSCSYSPTYIIFSPDSSCSDEAVNCTASGSDVSYNVNCSYDREAYSSAMIDDRTYLLIEEYHDEECSDYSSSQTFVMAEVCQVVSSTDSIIGVVNSDGSANVIYYNGSVTCQGDIYLNVTVDQSEINDHKCLKQTSSNLAAQYFRPYSNIATVSSASASASSATDSSSSLTDNNTNSSDGLTTPAIIGIIVATVVVVVAAVGLLIICLRRRRKNKDTQMSRGEALLPHQNGLWHDDDIVASRIPRANVHVKQMISHGAYGEVYLGSFDGNTVAVKMLPREARKNIAQVNLVLSEAKLMARMDHPRIVQLVGVAWNSLSDLCVVSEFMAGGDLRALLNTYEADPVHHPLGFNYDKMKIAAHILNGLVYMHSLQPMVLHRDLKSKNILLSENLDAKLTDFGVSRERADATMTAGVGTSLWMAPEVLVGDRYDDKADVFSFGVVLAELDAHSLPYKQARQSITGVTMSETAVLQLVSVGKLQVEFSGAASSSMVELGLRCVSVDPRARPSAAEALYRLSTIARNEMRLVVEA